MRPNLQPFASITALLVLLACASCTSSKPDPDPDHFASVVIHGKSLEEIYLAAAEVFKADGYRPVPSGSHGSMRFEKEGSTAQKWAHSSFMSVNDGPSVLVRVKAQVVPLEHGAERLQCEAFLVTDSGAAFYEDEHKVPKHKRKPYQELLDRVALKLK